MVKRILLGMVLLLLMVTIGCSQEPEQSLQRSSESSPLILTIKSDKEVYEVGEEIVLEATLKNNSDKEMIVFWSDKNPGMDTSGRTINLGFYNHSASDAIYIKPAVTFTKSVSFNNDFSPGPYRVTIQLNNQNVGLDFKTAQSQEIFDGTLTSNTITIKVKAKK